VSAHRDDQLATCHDHRSVFRERPANFDELVAFERRMLETRGWVQFVDDHNRAQRVYLSSRRPAPPAKK